MFTAAGRPYSRAIQVDGPWIDVRRSVLGRRHALGNSCARAVEGTENPWPAGPGALRCSCVRRFPDAGPIRSFSRINTADGHAGGSATIQLLVTMSTPNGWITPSSAPGPILYGTGYVSKRNGLALSGRRVRAPRRNFFRIQKECSGSIRTQRVALVWQRKAIDEAVSSSAKPPMISYVTGAGCPFLIVCAALLMRRKPANWIANLCSRFLLVSSSSGGRVMYRARCLPPLGLERTGAASGTHAFDVLVVKITTGQGLLVGRHAVYLRSVSDKELGFDIMRVHPFNEIRKHSL